MPRISKIVITGTLLLLVTCQPGALRLPENFPVGQYKNLEGDLGGSASDFLETICSQAPDQNGMVFGAINHETGSYLDWEGYWEDEDRGTDTHYLFARDPWETFVGSCTLRATSTYVRDRPPVLGDVVRNVHWAPQTRRYELTAGEMVPGFYCKTELESWNQRLQSLNPLNIPTLIMTNMVGLPETIQHTWLIREFPVDDWREYKQETDIQACHAAQLSVAMVNRTVIAYQGFKIDRYYWNGRTRRGSANTWKGRNGWGRIFVPENTVTCSGIDTIAPGERQTMVVQKFRIKNMAECF
jgi:hypothetical protein